MCGHCSSVCPKEAVTVTGFHTKQYPQTKSVRLNPDEVLDVIRFRRTVRRFKDKKIPDAVIAQILEAGRLTHTAKNMQDVSFVVLNKKSRNWSRWLSACSEKSSLWQICSVQWPEITRYMIIFLFFQAPIVVVILAKDKTNGLLAAQNMEFIAEANGLGVLYSGFFTICRQHFSGRSGKALNVPKGKTVAATTLVLGYPGCKISPLRPER